MRCSVRLSVACVGLLAGAMAGGQSLAAPLVLYDATAPGTDLKAAPQTPQTCGLTTPCTDLNTAAGARYVAPFSSGIQYGLSGVASAGVSNHGQGGSIGLLGWVKPTDDTTLYIGLSVGATRWDGQKVTLVPAAPPRP